MLSVGLLYILVLRRHAGAAVAAAGTAGTAAAAGVLAGAGWRALASVSCREARVASLASIHPTTQSKQLRRQVGLHAHAERIRAELAIMDYQSSYHLFTPPASAHPFSAQAHAVPQPAGPQTALHPQWNGVPTSSSMPAVGGGLPPGALPPRGKCPDSDPPRLRSAWPLSIGVVHASPPCGLTWPLATPSHTLLGPLPPEPHRS